MYELPVENDDSVIITSLTLFGVGITTHREMTRAIKAAMPDETIKNV